MVDILQVGQNKSLLVSAPHQQIMPRKVSKRAH